MQKKIKKIERVCERVYHKVFRRERKLVMQRIKMHFEEVQTYAKVYGNAEVEIMQLLQRLQQTQTQLHDVWEGKAMQAFDQQYDTLAPRVKEFAGLMKAIQAQLVHVAQAMQEMDVKLHQAILNV